MEKKILKKSGNFVSVAKWEPCDLAVGLEGQVRFTAFRFFSQETQGFFTGANSLGNDRPPVH